jgi:hypothetical protein
MDVLTGYDKCDKAAQCCRLATDWLLLLLLKDR